MNSTSPPPMPPDMEYQPPQPPRGMSTGAKWGIGCGSGCLVALLIVGILGYFGWVKTKEIAGRMIEEYTDDAPVTFTAPQADQATIDGVVARFDDFRDAMKNGQEAEPLRLTGEEINLLIYNHPDWKEMAGHTSVTIEGEQLKGQVSIPLGEIMGMLKGRYLNGTAAVRVALEDGYITGFIDGIEVAGKEAPPEVIKELQKENIFKDSQRDPELRKLTESLESIRIENGQLIVVPKPASERPSASAPAEPAVEA